MMVNVAAGIHEADDADVLTLHRMITNEFRRSGIPA